jgi:putative hydroxymethylpyrimidine transport system substrate-binding protein
MNRLAVLALCLVMVPLLAACGEKKDVTSGPAGGRQPFTLMLDWVPNADHVGVYNALARGDFAKVGIDPRVEVPNDPAAPLQLLAAGKIDAAISYEPEVMLARNRGLALVSVAAIVQQPLTSIISVGSKHITSAAALRGKRVGDAGISYQHAYLKTILGHSGIPLNKVSEVNVGANLVPAMLSGRVDATLGGYWNYEAIQLQQAGKHPNVIRMDQVGVPTYDELVLVVRRSTLTGRTDLVRRFVQALGRGYEAARADPAAAVDALLKANPGLGRQLQQAAVKATLPAFFPAGGQPWGWQSPTRWNAYGQWMLSNHLISNPQAVADASTNELLPGQGP